MSHKLLDHLRSLPRPLTIGAGLFVAVLLGLLLFSGPSSPPPAKKAVAFAAPPIAVSRPVPAAVPPPVGAVISPKPAPASAGTGSVVAMPALGPVMLPSQQEPVGIQRGYSTRVLEAGAASGNSGLPTEWTLVATTAEATPTASYTTNIGSDLQSMAPTSGFVRDRWTAWFQVQNEGSHTIVLRLEAGPTKQATVAVDGQAEPAITAKRQCGGFVACTGGTTGMATIGLAAGWHQVEVDVTNEANAEAAVASLYLRGPAASLPTALVPFAQPSATGKAGGK